MQKSTSYRLVLEPAGKTKFTMPYRDQSSMQNWMKLQLKKHFAGKMEPQVLIDNVWRKDEESAVITYRDEYEIQAEIFKQAGELFLSCAKIERRLTWGEEEALCDMIEAVQQFMSEERPISDIEEGE